MKQVSFLMTALMLLATNSRAQDVRYNFADASFKKFKTYKWVVINDVQKIDPSQDHEIKSALDAAISKKHLIQTLVDTADLYIGYQVGVAAEKPFAFYSADWDYGPGWDRESWYGGFYGRTKGPISTISEGQLAVDIYDSKNHCLIWRGVVSNAVDSTATADKRESLLHKAVTKLFNKYPPPPLYSFSD